MRLITKTHKQYFLKSLVVASVLGALLVIALPPNVLAANVYQTVQNGDCASSGGEPLDPPIVKDGKQYWCASDIQATDWQLATYQNGKYVCPDTYGGFTYSGLGCINPDKAQAIKSCTANNGTGDCNLVDKGSQACTGGSFCGIFDKYLTPAVELLGGIVGIIVIIMIIVGGIQYSSAGGDPQKVAAAKKRVANALFALLAYALLLGFLQWLVPGGII